MKLAVRAGITPMLSTEALENILNERKRRIAWEATMRIVWDEAIVEEIIDCVNTNKVPS